MPIRPGCIINCVTIHIGSRRRFFRKGGGKVALRLLEVFVKTEREGEVKPLLEDLDVVDCWNDHLGEGESIVRVLLPTEQTEEMLDRLEKALSGSEGFRVVILSPEATIPRPEEEEERAEEESNTGRISVEELYQKIEKDAGVTRKYLVMVVLASFVAATGLLKDDVAVVIGSMVIAPLLSPFMALSLATTLADFRLAREAAATTLAGSAVALAIGLLMGLFMEVDPGVSQLASRADISHYYIFLALASGAAGAFSLTTAVSEALVGVMVAVALLPPLAATGILFGSGHPVDAFGALLLFLVNVASVNLSGVLTFVAQGVRPRRWWEAKKARRATVWSVVVWAGILAVLAVLIYIEQRLKAG